MRQLLGILNIVASLKQIMIGAIFSLASFGFVDNLNGQCNHPDDYTALRALYLSTDGDNWTDKIGWPSRVDFLANPTPPVGTDMSGWYGIRCSGRVYCIDLDGFISCDSSSPSSNGNNLVGIIPDELNKLNELQTLSLAKNKLIGGIPNLNLNKLWRLWLHENQLTGSIPNFNLPSLLYFRASNNKLTGSIPNFNFPDLLELSLERNELSGSIPDLYLPNLNSLNLSANKFNGQIPNFNYPKLHALILERNEFIGSIPNFNLPKLNSMLLSNNKLTGSIPNFDLPNLYLFTCFTNDLDGCIPSSFNLLCDSINVENGFFGIQKVKTSIFLNNNPLLPWQGDFAQFCATDGSQQAQIGAPCNNGNALDGDNDIIQDNCRCGLLTPCNHPDFDALMELYDSTNGPGWTDKTGWEAGKAGNSCDPCNFNGSTWFGINCSNGSVVSLNLSNNQLEGTIPNFNLPNLEILRLNNNQLFGNIPNFNTPNLKTLSLSTNQLSGSIPNLDLPNLQVLFISNNQFTGSIPNFNLPKLQNLSISNNQLTGSIPNINLPELSVLALNTNQLVGSIPSFNLLKLNSLDLSNNQLSGSLPDFNFPVLSRLNLSQNQLSGNIPNFNSVNLIAIDLSYNKFIGSIPDLTLASILSDDYYINFSNNRLSGCIPFYLRTYCDSFEVNLSNNPLLPWLGEFGEYCATDGSQQAQIGAQCDNNNPIDGEIDVIQDDCSCGTYDCQIQDTVIVCSGHKLLFLPSPFNNQISFDPPNAGYYDSIFQCVIISENFTGYADVYTDQTTGLACFKIFANPQPINDDPNPNSSRPPFTLNLGNSHTSTTCCAIGVNDRPTLDFPNVACSNETQDDAVWYTYTTGSEIGIEIIVRQSGGTPISNNTTIEVLQGSVNGPSASLYAPNSFKCGELPSSIKIGCYEQGEVIWIKIATTENDCGEFAININPINRCPMADLCEEVVDVIMPNPTEPNCGNATPVNISGCIENACAEKVVADCGFGDLPTVWYKVVVDDEAVQLQTTVTTGGTWDPIWAIYYGDCTSPILLPSGSIMEPVACSNGDANANIHSVGRVQGVDTYWIAVAGDGVIDDPNFTLGVTILAGCVACIGEAGCDPQAKWEITKRSSTRQLNDHKFNQGEEVTVCISFDYDASETGVDWLHGLIPDFGPGWDLLSFDPNEIVVSPNGAEWKSIDEPNCAPVITEHMPFLCTYTDSLTGRLVLCNTQCQTCPCNAPLLPNSSLPSGWFWSQDGGAGCENGCRPSTNHGIGNTVVSINFCIDLKVREFETQEECKENSDLRFNFQTTSHGVSGCWNDPIAECKLDFAQIGPAWQIDCDCPNVEINFPKDEITACNGQIDEIPLPFSVLNNLPNDTSTNIWSSDNLKVNDAIDNSKTPAILNVSEAGVGNHSLIVSYSQRSCTWIDSISVKILETGTTLLSSDTIFIEKGLPSTVNILNNDALPEVDYVVSLIDFPSELLSLISFEQDGNITVLVEEDLGNQILVIYKVCDECGECNESNIIVLDKRLKDIVLTTLFTPKENANNTLQFSEEPIPGSELWIYNRWGQEIFHKKDYENDWNADGYPGGVYFYVLDVYGIKIKKTLTVVK